MNLFYKRVLCDLIILYNNKNKNQGFNLQTLTQ